MRFLIENFKFCGLKAGLYFPPLIGDHLLFGRKFYPVEGLPEFFRNPLSRVLCVALFSFVAFLSWVRGGNFTTSPSGYLTTLVVGVLFSGGQL